MAKKQHLVRQSPLVTTAILAASIATLYVAHEVLVPIILSTLLAFLLATPASWLERRRLGRVPSVLVVVTLAFAIIGTIGYVVGQQAVSLTENMEQYRGEIQRKVTSMSGTGSGFGQKLAKFSRELQSAAETPATKPATQTSTAHTSAPEGDAGLVQSATHEVSNAPGQAAAREITGGAAPTTAPGPAGSNAANPLFVTQASSDTAVQRLLDYGGYVAGPLGTAGLVVVFVIFILLEREALRDRFIAVISRGNYTVTTRAINDAGERISRYLLAQSMVNGSYGCIIGAGLFFIGLAFGHGVWFPSFVLWGLLCGVLRFIPYVGPAVSSLFPVALALAVYPGFTVAIAVISLFLVIELISNNVMEPWLYGASTGLSTVAILVAAIFWTWLWGPIGLLVATPLTVCLAVIGKYVKPLRFLHILLGDEEALPPAVSFYQRLLAGDRVDALRIVRRITEASGAAVVPDIVYLPAMRMARRDRHDDALTADVEHRILEDTLTVAAEVGQKSLGADPAPAPPASAPLVLAFPAHHRADEVTLRLLGDSLAPLGVRTTVMSTKALPAEVEATIEREKPKFLVIGIMPPGGLPQTRYLCRRLRKKFPDLIILVGFWGRSRDFDRLLVRLREAGASYVATSIEQTCGHIGAMLPKPPATEPPAGSVS